MKETLMWEVVSILCSIPKIQHIKILKQREVFDDLFLQRGNAPKNMEEINLEVIT